MRPKPYARCGRIKWPDWTRLAINECLDLHLVAARKAKAARLYTLNVANFRSFHRPGDPEIVHP